MKTQPVSATSAEIPSRFALLDRPLLLSLFVYGVVAVVFLTVVPLHFLPADDAVILFQYSRNLAQHGSISFVAGGPHVEGATDFAWMFLVACGMRVGIPAFWLSAAGNVLSIIGIAWVLLRMARIPISVRTIFTIAGAAALFPQIFAAASGFALLIDALLLTILAYFVSTDRVWGASTAAFVFCLFRPDGVIFALPLLSYFLLKEGNRIRSLSAICATFIAPGVLYFLWRWFYFGELLPLPFLVKADAQRFAGLFVGHSVSSSLIFVMFSIVALLPLRAFRTPKNLIIAFGLMVIPTLFYWMMRLDQNVGARFFYYLPLGTAILIALNWPTLRKEKIFIFRAAFIAWALLIAMPTYRQLRTFRDEQFVSVEAIARDLAMMPKHGIILTTEAGFLPYYSGWSTYDAWGLNTPEFAHRFFQPQDVVRVNPDLIALHPDRPESCVPQADWKDAYADRSWPHLTRNLIRGADPSHYELWLTSYGSEYYRARKHWQYGEGDRECWLIRKDSPLHAALAGILTKHKGIASSEALQMEKAHTDRQP